MIAEQYKKWIDENVTGMTRGFCRCYSEKMCKEFPELRLVRGFYKATDGGSYGHWWCVTPEGVIVDPTEEQFWCVGQGVYEEYDEEIHGPLPIGKCLYCGCEYFENHGGTCSEECYAALSREYQLDSVI